MADNIQERAPRSDPNEVEFVGQLFKLIEPEQNPYRAEYEETMRKCYKFRELNQWDQIDQSALAVYGVPPIAVDRINRGIDTIIGKRQDVGMKRKVTKREMGDERVAEILDKVYDQVEYSGDFEDIADEAFDHLLVVGLGVKKCGFDYGTRKIWSEYATPEQMWVSPCKMKNLSDARWFVQRHVMSWEEAALLAPEKAGEVKGLKTSVESNWQKIEGESRSPVTTSKDYGSTQSSGPIVHKDSVEVYEFWIKRIQPYTKVGMVVPVPQQMKDGSIVAIPTPQWREEAEAYQTQPGEQTVPAMKEFWEQYVVAGDKKNNIILLQGKDDDHPFVGYCAERKKNGAPVGYVEKAIPHQVRINLAWAQKVAFNNKSLKSPLIARDIVDVDAITKQSAIGMILNLTGIEKIEALNTQPQVNLQAIEEGSVARQDLDFAAAATEETMRGVSSANASAARYGMQREAASMPLNKWVKAEQKGDRIYARKILKLIIKYFSPDDMRRIIGEQEWMRLTGPKDDPLTGMQILPALGMPINVSVLDYDVVIMDQSLSDFNKQQTFNSTEALVSGGVPMTDEFRIKSAPIKNVDEALESNRQQRNDIIVQLMGVVQQLQGELQIAQKNQKPMSQAGNAQRGKAQPQVGKRAMMGGQNG